MSGEVGSTSPVVGTRFATTARQHLRILRDYRRIAMVGLSANPYRPSHFAALYMQAAGYRIFPVNPREKEILGRPCYASLAEVPKPVEIVDIFRERSAVPAIVEEAIAAGAKVVWLTVPSWTIQTVDGAVVVSSSRPSPPWKKRTPPTSTA